MTALWEDFRLELKVGRDPLCCEVVYMSVSLSESSIEEAYSMDRLSSQLHVFSEFKP
jgi:hypothetical protein